MKQTRTNSNLLIIAAIVIFCTNNVNSYSTVTPPPQGLQLGKILRPFSKNEIDQSSTSYESIDSNIGEDTQKRGWGRRVFGKVLRRSRRKVESNGLKAHSISLSYDESILERQGRIQNGYFVQKRQFKSPEAMFYPVFSELPLPLEQVPVTDQIQKGSPFVRVTRNAVERILAERLDRWSKGKHENMKVSCEPTGNLKQFVSGKFLCDATVDLDRIEFGNIRFSGGKIEAKDFCLNPYSFAPNTIPLAPTYRFPNQFDFVASDVIFTQDDLFESSCIRNGLRRLLTRILKNKGLTALTVDIQSIKILRSGKVSCRGQATTLFGPLVPFEVRSGLNFSGDGHVLTFPGLEISINPSLGLFVPVIPEITLFLGKNAQLLDVQLDGEAAEMRLSARVTITPEHSVREQKDVSSTTNHEARCSFDVGRWLTRLGRFTI